MAGRTGIGDESEKTNKATKDRKQWRSMIATVPKKKDNKMIQNEPGENGERDQCGVTSFGGKYSFQLSVILKGNSGPPLWPDGQQANIENSFANLVSSMTQ